MNDKSSERWKLAGKLCLFCLATVMVVNESVPYFLSGCPQTKTMYGWEMLDTNGEPVSQNCGELKLVISPSLVYENLPNQITAHFTTGEFGFRGPSAIDRNPGAVNRKIFLLGGSQTFGTGLNNDNETVAGQLSALLKDTTVFNAGVIGYSSGQELVQLVTRIIDFKPDLLITISGWNDLVSLFVHRSLSYDPSFGYLGDYEHQLKLAAALSYRGLFERSEVAFPRLVASNFISLSYRRNTENAVDDSISESAVVLRAGDSYLKNILKMHEVARSMKVPLLVVLQPDLNVIFAPEFSQVTKAYNKFRRLVAKKLGDNDVLFIDANDRSIPFTPEMFMDSIHLNKEGNNKLAHSIAEKVGEIDKSYISKK